MCVLRHLFTSGVCVCEFVYFAGPLRPHICRYHERSPTLARYCTDRPFPQSSVALKVNCIRHSNHTYFCVENRPQPQQDDWKKHCVRRTATFMAFRMFWCERARTPSRRMNHFGVRALDMHFSALSVVGCLCVARRWRWWASCNSHCCWTTGAATARLLMLGGPITAKLKHRRRSHIR